MRPLLPQHRRLSGAMIAVVACSLLAYLFLARPRSKDVADIRHALEDKQRRLARAGWPLDAERLEALDANMKRQLEGNSRRRPGTAREATGTRSRAELVFREATSNFDSKVEELFGSTELFVKGVSRLDYEEEFSRLKQGLEAKGIFLAEEILNLGESTSSPYTYQLVLQVWTLDMLVNLALENQLQLVSAPGVSVASRAGEKRAAQVVVLPMRAYYLDRDDDEPYVLEFPVRMSLECRLHNLVEFLQCLHAEGRFLPVRHMELFTGYPGDQRCLENGHVRVEQLRVELECSTFFRLRDTPPALRRGLGAERGEGA